MPCVAERPACPLCHTAGSSLFCTAPQGHKLLDYYRCSECRLTFVAPAQLPTLAEEKAEYDLHCNDPQDAGYRAFLARLAAPLQALLPPAAVGLDFGCGPGPTLSSMFREAGFSCADYDPLYANDPQLLTRDYDFVSCTEVAEHFHQPGDSFALLQRLLRPGGVLGVMTRWLMADAQFERWHYRRDPSHVCFYKPATFEWIAARWDLVLHLPATDIALLQRP